MERAVILMVVFLLVVVQGVSSIRILRSHINETVVRGSSLTLICQVDSQGQTIYQAKWYKDEEEFFQYRPNQQPIIRIFPVNGTEVNRDASGLSQVTLSNVDLDTAGRYGCEITTQKTYNTVTAIGTVIVVDLPRKDPQIRYSGGGSRDVNEVVRAECACAQSIPAANLSWFINDENTSSNMLTRYPTSEDPDGLQTSTLGLAFLLRESHFQRGKVTLKCVARLYDIYYASALVQIRQISMAQRSSQTSDRSRIPGSGSAALEHCSRALLLAVLCSFSM